MCGRKLRPGPTRLSIRLGLHSGGVAGVLHVLLGPLQRRDPEVLRLFPRPASCMSSFGCSSLAVPTRVMLEPVMRSFRIRMPADHQPGPETAVTTQEAFVLI